MFSDDLKIQHQGCRGSYYIRLLVYMVSPTGHARIYFPGTRPEEAIELIASMEKDGYRKCGWFRWFTKKIQCWLSSQVLAKITIRRKDGLSLFIQE